MALMGWCVCPRLTTLRAMERESFALLSSGPGASMALVIVQLVCVARLRHWLWLGARMGRPSRQRTRVWPALADTRALDTQMSVSEVRSTPCWCQHVPCQQTVESFVKTPIPNLETTDAFYSTSCETTASCDMAPQVIPTICESSCESFMELWV
jgi:hypothetical protein